MAFGGDGLGGGAVWHIAIGGDYEGFVFRQVGGLAQESVGAAKVLRDISGLPASDPSVFGLTVFDLQPADVAVVRRVEGVGQAKDGRQLDRRLLFVRQKVAQGYVAARGQCAAVEARDGGGALHVLRIPSQGRAVGLDQLKRRLVVSFVSFCFADTVQDRSL